MSKKLKHIKILEEMNSYSNDEKLFEMANIRQDITGLPVIIWISIKMSNHGPRIKVQQNYSKKAAKDLMFSVTIENAPKIIGDTGNLKQDDINKVVEFVIEHKNILLQYWNDKVGIDEVIKAFKEKNKLFENEKI